MNRSQRLGLFALIFLATLFAALSGCGPKKLDEESSGAMEQAIERAKTKTDHEALAARYEKEANALMEKATRHEKMASAYRKTDNPKFGGDAARHCLSMVSYFREAAVENQELAKMHRQMAGELG